ncbi:hypothetical protein L228DRAFT_108164 [Xylona heveae TC161]|uniref:Thioredoxin domain-containing protein n=1 Tax=Xylona heveae (strain CBS 132557 / TC161) TaxID=1328760 RepID=A0A165HCV5_XYLHT|nr:hypothetical protein L228DRAFT_108164 [Xylona heveae TC161]KZF23316.1 hypothetical protein L228DRAFT_108164 [Xylona heveae TC161]
MLRQIRPFLKSTGAGALKTSCLSRTFHYSANSSAQNRVYNSIRHEDEFSSLLLLSASNNVPLVTLWTASWCPSCKVVAPMLKDLIERERVGEQEGGVHYAEVEIDSPTIGDLAMRYMITSLPTLLSFSREEAQMETRVTALKDLKRPDFLREWLEAEARRGGAGGSGGGGPFGLFGR